jgi:hypothetical protein
MAIQRGLFESHDHPVVQKAKEALGAVDVSFDGKTASAKHDQVRLAGQTTRVFLAMKDARYRTLDEIAAITGDGQASISARLRDLRKEKFGGHTVNRRSRGDRACGLYEYQLIVKAETR